MKVFSSTVGPSLWFSGKPFIFLFKDLRTAADNDVTQGSDPC
jgi:hypothetical protein